MSEDEGIVFYLTRLDNTSKTVFRIFDRTEFYSLHFDNAITIANEFLRSPEAIKYIGRTQIPSVSISIQNYESLLRELLLVKQYRVELHSKRNGSWKQVAKASPGNLIQFEDSLFLNHEVNETGGVTSLYFVLKDGTYTIGVVSADVMLKQISFCEVYDTEIFTVLESVLVQLSPKECLVSLKDTTPEYKKINKILQQMGIFVISPKANAFTKENGRKYVSRLAQKEDGVTSLLTSSDDCLKAFTCLVQYLDIVTDDSNFNQYEISQIKYKNYMRLDGAAFSGLNLFPSSPIEPKFSSLFGILNNCSTPQGQRLLGKWLKQPLLDINEINERLNIVESLVEDTQLRQDLTIGLKRFPDFYRIAKKVQRGKGKLQDCYKLYMAVLHLPRIIDILGTHSGTYETSINCKFITPFREFEHDFTMFKEMIETTVDLDKCGVGEYVILPSFDENLSELRSQLEDLEEKIEMEYTHIAKLLKSEKGKGVKLDCNGTYGHHCRVTRKDEKGIRNNRKFEILQTKKDGVLFCTGTLRTLSEACRGVRKNYEEVQASIVDEVMKVAAGYAEPMIHLNDTIAYMDCLVSFAMAAVNAPIPYVRPDLRKQGSGLIELVGSRHPCVEANDDIAFISNDVKLDQNSGAGFLVVTGPNMGGKSTYIRQIGAIVLLAQIGCFVPCEAATISIVSSIFARVGAADNQARGISTFMAEMLETAAILQSTDSDSLVIIDELGRGTSTYDGFGLAWAISNYIITRIKCLTVFATHFHEMTNLEQTHSTVRNYHVSALVQDQSLTLLYKVQPGPCDQSFGVHVARLAEFPEHIIALAEEKAAQLDRFRFVPEECASQQPEFEEAAKIVNLLLGEVRTAYESGNRGSNLQSVVTDFVSAQHNVLSTNSVLKSFLSTK